MSTIHPRKSDKGLPVKITKPSAPTTLDAWANPAAIATVLPAGPMPADACGISFSRWYDAPTGTAGWAALEQGSAFSEPPMTAVPGKQPAAGVVTIEPDGRVWLVAPTDEYGGYKATFPKGRLDGLSPRAGAIREAFEESGLRVELTGFLCDTVRSTTVTRYYTAKRVGGNPADMGWESQAVLLVPLSQLRTITTHPNDAPILKALPTKVILAYEWGLASGHRVLACIAAYRAKYGEWPTKLTIPVGMYEGLRDTILSPYGWRLLNERLHVAEADAEMFYVEGQDSERQHYDADGPQHFKVLASEWLWGTDLT